MNRIFRVIWSHVLSTWIAVSENTKGRGKSATKRKVLISTLALSLAPLAQAAPTGGQVVSGSGTIAQTGSTTNIQQTSQNLSLNWQTFNVSPNETVNYLQPSATAIAVNRIFDTNGSQILGHLNANGQVWLINPNGVLFGQGAQVNVGGLVASTLDFNDAQIGSGSVAFSGNGSGSIINQGTINAANGGYVALLGNHVGNQGSIVAQLGSVVLGASSAATLTFNGSGLAHMQVDQSTLDNLAENGGLIQANGGQIVMTAGAQNALLASVVNNTGILEAHAVENQNGTIILSAGTTAGTANIGGTVDVSSTTGNGGTLIATAHDVLITDNASINASGATGGGSVNIGGDWQGSGDIAQATTVTMAAGARIDASATQQGNGGKVVLWSDVHNADSQTTVNGSITALGGPLGGNGGQVETSGHQVGIDGAKVNAGAPAGAGGEWLIDPYSYTIGASQISAIVGDANSGLNSGTSVTVDTALTNSSYGSSGNPADAGDIMVTAAINKTLGGNATLTLKAARHISLQSGATINASSGLLNLQLWADSDNSGDGIVQVTSTSLNTNGGWLKFGNNQTASINGSTVLVGGDVYFNGVSAQTISTGGGALDIYGETIVSNTGGITFDSGGGNVGLHGVLNSGNLYTYVDGPDGTQSWTWARTDAKNGTAGGAAVGNSYLVTITSRLENALAGLAAGYKGGWIGAYRANPTSTFAWTWADGPEAGAQFYTQNSTGGGGTTTASYYSNFGSGEPNGTLAGNESAGQFFGTAGLWNDLTPNTTFSATPSTNQYAVLGYVRETNLASSAVTINAGTGQVTIDGGVGGSKALASLTVNAASTTINGSALVTTGAQTYNNALTANSTADLRVAASALTITNANQALSLNATGNITVDSPSSVAGPISIYGGNVSLNNSLTATASGATILISANGNISTANTAKTITTNNGNLSLIADADANGAGLLDLDYTTMSAGSGNVVVRGETMSWAVGVGQSPTITSTTGTFTFESSDASFGQGVDTAWFYFPSTLSGFTVGKSTNTQDVVSTNALSVNGPISLYGGNISVNANLTSTASGADVLLKGSGSITLASNKSISTTGGDVTFWADSDSTNGGYIWLNSGSSISTTSAANIILSGGNVAQGDLGTTGYAMGMTTTMGNGVTLDAATLNSYGGDIAIRGKSTTGAVTNYASTDYVSASTNGIRTHGSVTVDSGSGLLSLYGYAQATSGNSNGIETSGTGTSVFRSSSTSANAITLDGTAITAAALNAWGVYLWGGTSILATNGGGINITGSGAKNSGVKVDTGSSVLANSGAIALTGTGYGAGYSAVDISSNVGQKSGSTIASSSSNITVNGDVLSLTGAIASTGQLTLQSYGTSFASAFTVPSASVLSSLLTGLTIGKTSNTQNITIGSAISIAGPINIYGGNITVNTNLTSTASGADILLKGSGNVIANANLVTNAGDITLWADSDASGAGGIQVTDNRTLDSRTASDRTAGNTSTASGGGSITLAGGLDDGGAASGSNSLDGGLLASDGRPDGYAVNLGSLNAQTGVLFGNDTGVGHNAAINLYSGGGDIAIHGKATTLVGGGPVGVGAYQGLTVNAGTSGDLTLVGVSAVSGVVTLGMDLAAWRSNGYVASSTFTTANGNVLIVGRASGGTSNFAMAIDGTSTNRDIFAATGTGSVTLDGQATGTSPTDIRLTGVDVLAASGNISLIGRSAGGLNISNWNGSNGVYLGAKAGSVVTSSTSNVLIEADAIATADTLAINTSGAVTVAPYGNSFTSALTWSQGGLTLAGGISSLTLGKTTNTADITVGSAQSITGPINIYGGNINLNANLTSTASNTAILAQATGNILQAASVAVTTNGGSVTYDANSTGSGSGGIVMYSGASITSNGGNITLGGGLTPTTTYAVGTGASAQRGIWTTLGTTLDARGSATGGNIVLNGQGTTGGEGILLGFIGTGSQPVIQTNNAGTISLNGWGGAGLTNRYTTGIGMASGVIKSGSGAINIVGHGGGNSNNQDNSGIYLWGSGTNILSTSGAISLNGTVGSSPNIGSGIRMLAGSVIGYDSNLVASSSSDITLTSDTLLLAGALQSSGALVIEPLTTSFSSAFSTSGLSISGNPSSLRLGKAGNTADITVGSAQNITGPINIYGGNITVNAALTATNSTISLTGSGNITDGVSGYLVADNLLLLGGNVTLDHASNNVNTLAASGVSGLTYTDSNALTIGSVGSTNGITATGAVALTSGTLTTTQAINAGSSNITLSTDSLALGANVISTGALQIQPKTTGATLGIGTGSGTVQIGADQLAWLQDGFSSITLGGSTTGAVQIGGLSTWNDPLVAQAGTGSDLQVVGNMSWSHANSLTLKAGNNIFVNANLAASNAAAALNIFYGGTNGTTAPTAGTSYFVNLANRNTIQLTGSAPTLTLGNISYTVVNDVTALQGMSASGNYALGHGLSLAGTSYSTAFYTPTFTGKFDGLGNTLDGLTISNTAGGNLGLFAQVNGATVRQVGVTNMSITTNSTNLGTSANTTEPRVGGVIGNVGGAGAPTSSVTTLDGIWSTGTISTTAGSGQKFFFAGGLVGSQNGGTMNLSRSYSLANVSSQGSYSSNLAIGGLIGDIGINTNVLTAHTLTTSSTVAFTISKGYSTGSIVEGSHGGYYGTGGLVGVVFSSGNSILDSYSWSNVVGNGSSFGGIAGFALAGTFDRLYTTQSTVGSMTGGTGTSVYNASTLNTSGGTVLPSGFSSNEWGVSSRPTLKSIPTPPTQIYVKESTSSGTYGNASTAYQLVDALGNPITLGTGSYAGLSGTTGTAHYSLDIGNTTTPGTYSLSYLSGLSFTGANALDFILNPYSTATTYTQAKAPLTVTANTANKVYDGATYGGGYSVGYSAFANGESSSVLGGTLSFSGSSQAATNSGTYTIVPTGLTSNNYSFTYVNGALNIDKRPLTLSGSRVYDGTTSISVSALIASNLVGSDCASGLATCGVTGSASFASQNVNAGSQTLTLNGLTLGSTLANNYTLTGASGTATITAKTVTLSASKTYDGTTSLTGAVTLGTGIAGETLTYSGATANDAHVATANKYISALTLADATDLSGGLASNYQLPTLNAANAAVTISTKALTSTASIGGTLSKVYDGTTSATAASVSGSVSGAVSGDTLSLDTSGVTLAYNSAHVVGANRISASGNAGYIISSTVGSLSSDYSFSNPTIADATASITEATLTLSLTNTGVSKTYDGTLAAPTGFTPSWGFSGLVTGDTTASVTSTGAAYNSKDVTTANKVTVSGVSLTGIAGSQSSAISDYVLAATSVDVAATITAKSVTLSASKTYDGTTSLTGAVTLGTGIAGETLTYSGATANDAHVATANKYISALTLADATDLSGGLASNYQLPTLNAANAAVTISTKALTSTASIGGTLSKVYDGTTSATSASVSGSVLGAV
ncbi:MAG: filamentous hemagglutinin N-terminal domain-containing protein, partial [Sideroxydans sp.]|nr:filamentous hemagglutinin N-terminal domain-containing protein [Sideroxydans sp.]